MPNYIGLVGTNGAGKSRVCEYLHQAKGFDVISLSDEVRNVVKKIGLPPTRDHLVATANDLKREHGKDFLAVRCLSEAKRQTSQNVIFDSIRNLEEVTYLRQENIFMIGIDADIKIRFHRIQERQKQTDRIDFETFQKHDQRENEGNSYGQSINDTLQACDVIIFNNGTTEDLFKEIDQIIEKKSK